MNKKIKLSLASQIFIALFLGIIAGLIFIKLNAVEFATYFLQPIGTIFLNLLKFVVVPIVLTSIIDGIVSLKDIKKVGTIGLSTIIYYSITTAFAVAVGLLFANLFKGSFKLLQTSGLSFDPGKATSIMETLVQLFPKNVLGPLVEANMLQTIVISLFIGFGIIIAGEKGDALAKLNHSVEEVFMIIMNMIIKTSPIAVFCLITPVIATNGANVIGSLFMVIVTAYIAYIVHMAVVYSFTVKTLGNTNPLTFFKAIMPAMLFGFSSASSVGTLPINSECLEENLGIRKDIVSFVLPLGATINMDGTAIYQGVCSVFIAACYGITLTPSQLLTIVVTATLASIGTAGTPGSGMIMLAMVLQSVGLPVEGIALVAGIDRIFDMGRTVVNITGDASCTVIVNHRENLRMAKNK
jgi:putative proton/sodium-glutamate symport protein gltT